MHMMKKLLDNLGRSWNKLPKEVPALTIAHGTGMHIMVTVDSTQLHLHSTPFRSDMPLKQSIVLDGYTLQELVDVLTGMGYTATIASEALSAGLSAKKSYTLLTQENVPLVFGRSDTQTTSVLTAFSSPLWEFLYPIYRLLETADGDADEAIRVMQSSAARGRWLDYWASFFRIKRNIGEADTQLAGRTLMALVNMKTNDIAVQELVKYAVNTSVEITDLAPALFEVKIDPSTMSSSALVHATLLQAKGAGIAYILHYYGVYEENYQSYFKDKNQVEFKSSDIPSIDVTWGTHTELGFREITNNTQKGIVAFRLGFSKIGTKGRLGRLDDRLQGSVTMTFEKAGATTKTATYTEQ